MLLADLVEFVTHNRETVSALLSRYQSCGKTLFLRSDLWDEFELFADEKGEASLLSSQLAEVIHKTQEATLVHPWFCLDVRPRLAHWNFLLFNIETLEIEEISTAEFLRFKEGVVGVDAGEWPLEIDFGPFERDFPKMTQSRSIGKGVEYLNRRLSGRLSHDLSKGDELILSFLRLHSYLGTPFMVSPKIEDVASLQQSLRVGMEKLAMHSDSLSWNDVAPDLQNLGFEPGWGGTVKIIRENFSLLADILEAPDFRALEKFLSRIPMIFNIVILSPHGFFGQAHSTQLRL